MPTSEPFPCAVVPPGALPACPLQAARKSGAAMRRASLRIVFTSFRRFLCVRRRQAGRLGSPARPEERFRVPRDLPGQVADVDAALPGERRVRRRDVQRLVSAATGILGRKVRSVGLSEETTGRNPGRRGTEAFASGGRERAGERDVHPEIEPSGELFRALAVAMDHPADRETLAEYRPHAPARVTHGDYHWT